MENEDSNHLNDFFKTISGKILNKQTGIFLIFLVLSTILWFVSSLNEEVQRQVEYPLQITHVPDSVTFINTPPEYITVSMRGRGTNFFRHLLGSEPTVDIDFRKFTKDHRFVVTKSKLIEILQNTLGDERQIVEIYPDTIGVYYTAAAPAKVPVNVRVTASAAPNLHIFGPILPTPDSILLYSAFADMKRPYEISTAEVHLSDISSSRNVKVPLVAPAGFRVVPDSVTVKINVEPYVTITKTIPVEAINVPAGHEINFKPASVKTSFRVPKSKKTNLPEIKIIADFNSLTENPETDKIAINIEPWKSYIFTDVDSVSFYMSRKSK